MWEPLQSTPSGTRVRSGCHPLLPNPPMTQRSNPPSPITDTGDTPKVCPTLHVPGKAWSQHGYKTFPMTTGRAQRLLARQVHPGAHPPLEGWHQGRSLWGALGTRGREERPRAALGWRTSQRAVGPAGSLKPHSERLHKSFRAALFILRNKFKLIS